MIPCMHSIYMVLASPYNTVLANPIVCIMRNQCYEGNRCTWAHTQWFIMQSCMPPPMLEWVLSVACRGAHGILTPSQFSDYLIFTQFTVIFTQFIAPIIFTQFTLIFTQFTQFTLIFTQFTLIFTQFTFIAPTSILIDMIRLSGWVCLCACVRACVPFSYFCLRSSAAYPY